MVSSEPRRTTVSAPGKVLLAGGYLVLDPAHRGIVVSTSSRFFTSVLSPSAGLPPNTILVRSPQFLDAVWKYRVLPDGSLVEIYEESSEDGQQGNKFVRIALDKTIRVARELVGDAQVVNDVLEGGLEIVIAGDNDFYSQRAQVRLLSESFERGGHGGLTVSSDPPFACSSRRSSFLCRRRPCLRSLPSPRPIRRSPTCTRRVSARQQRSSRRSARPSSCTSMPFDQLRSTQRCRQPTTARWRSSTTLLSTATVWLKARLGVGSTSAVRFGEVRCTGSLDRTRWMT